MKNVLYVAYYYPPMKSGGTLRTEKFVKYLRKAGYRVCVLTASYGQNLFDEANAIIRVKDISHNKNRRGMRKFQWFALRIWTELQKKLGRHHSIYQWWRENAWRQRNKIIDMARPDLIIATYPPVETLEIAFRLREAFHVPMITDFRDGLLFEPIEQSLMQKYRAVRNHYNRLEKQAVEKSALITTVSKPITDYFLKNYPSCHVQTIYTGFDPEDWPNPVSSSNSGHSDTFRIVYTGRVSLSDSSSSLKSFVFAMEPLLRKYPETANKIRFRIAGEMSRKERRLMQPLMRIGVVTLCGLLERKEALALQREADLLLLITSTTRTSVVTTKIFEYLRSARPILALTKENTAVGELILKSNSGWVVHPEDSVSIKNLLQKFSSDAAFRSSLKPDRKAICRLSTKHQIEYLTQFINKILNDSNTLG